ncbi:hypothetical protein OH76DRAFT_1360023 [Lentinus brumalis]|uniref:Uncharacterized protein n=1 Tax=Lentinus brumalis TaxID=2498619 RepID=A0A371CV59_9APHY|nr:hypothetical protein OH76DRAFT_1360023 [Polyporus brumalis]
MRWTRKGYAFGVVCRGRHKLVGWPWYANIPFTNLSSIPGGQPTIRCLLLAWKLGILRFEPATEDEIDLARRNPDAVLPGAPPLQPAPFCWGSLGTNQMRKAKKNGVSLPLKKPLRGKRVGPISPKLVLDSDMGEDEEVCSDND